MSLSTYAVAVAQLPLLLPIVVAILMLPEESKANNLLALSVASLVNSVEEIVFETEALIDLSTSSRSC